MHVRLLKGEFFKADGFAIQDFEQLPEGDIFVPQANLGLADLFTGASLNGGCTFDYAILLPRQQ